MTGVTIVVPCHNHWQFIDECLSSVVAQTYTQWETIVVDDGSSTDGLEKARERWTDERIKWRRHPIALGPAAARNSGIRAACYPIIVTLDADDFLHPQYLFKLVSILDLDASVDCVFPDFVFFGVQNRIHTFDTFKRSDPGELARSQHLPAQVMMRKRLWEEVGGYFEDKSLPPGNEDWDFWLAAAEHGYRAVHIAEPLYYYRTQEQSLSIRLRAVDYLSRECMYARHRAFIDRYSSRESFLSAGYWRSAAAVCSSSSLGKALLLGARAFYLSGDMPLARNLLRNILSQARRRLSLRSAGNRSRVAR